MEAAGTNEEGLQVLQSETAVTPIKSRKKNKKRRPSDLDTPAAKGTIDIGSGEAADGVLVDDDLSEPTMGEKLASLDLLDGGKTKSHDEQEPSLPAKPPSADSVHVLLKQSLHADDRAVLLNCLYTQDEKVISKSISLLNSSDVRKLLQSLIYITESRGAILACALPWLRSLLLQHATGIMSQESSLTSLNSLYQLIESRVSTFESALKLSNTLDFLYKGVQDEDFDENDTTIPVIYEDKDSDEGESEDDAMETYEDDNREGEEAFGGLVSDVEESDGMID